MTAWSIGPQGLRNHFRLDIYTQSYTSYKSLHDVELTANPDCIQSSANGIA